MKSAKFKKSIYSIKYSLSEFVSNNKYKILVCLVFCFIGLLTGIFTAVKIYKLDDSDVFESFNLTYQLSDLENFSANFFGRLISYEMVCLLLLVFSLHPIMHIFGWCLLAYRSFLVAINCVMIILFFSFNGVIKSLLIILPCQLLMLVCLLVFFCFVSKQIKINKFIRCKKTSTILNPLLIVSLCLSIINLVETLLLFIFRSNIILVI